MGCFLNKSDIQVLFQKHVHSEGQRRKSLVSITDIFLLSIIATWGATIDDDNQPGLAYAMATQIVELRHDLNCEADTIFKFRVCFNSLNCPSSLLTASTGSCRYGP